MGGTRGLALRQLRGDVPALMPPASGVKMNGSGRVVRRGLHALPEQQPEANCLGADREEGIA